MFSFLLTWYNLPFLIALGSSAFFALLQVLGGIGDHDAHADTGADIDAHVDLHAAHPDLHAPPEHPDAHFEHDTHSPSPLAALGIGRVPLAIVLMALLGSFGAVGLIANTLLAGALGGYAPLLFPIVLVVSGALTFVLTGQISGLIARAAAESSTAVGFEQLVGRVGTVSSAMISPSYGRVSVRDHHGTIHTVYAVIEAGEPLPERSEVALVAYDEAQRRFVVRHMERYRPPAR